MSKTLIVYGTRFGATQKSSEVIARELEEKFNHEVEIIKISKEMKKIDYSNYDNIIIGSSIAYFSWIRSVKNFLKNDFTGKNVFVFISSAGLTYAALENEEVEKYNKRKKFFLDKVLERRLNVKPLSTAVFGGWIKNEDKPEGYDLYNWKEEDMIQWAEEIGKLTK